MPMAGCESAQGTHKAPHKASHKGLGRTRKIKKNAYELPNPRLQNKHHRHHWWDNIGISSPAASEQPSGQRAAQRGFLLITQVPSPSPRNECAQLNGFDQRLAPPAVCKCHTCHVGVA